MREILLILQDFSPMAVIALSLVIIYQLTTQRRSVNNLKNNHLHEVKDGLTRIESLLMRGNEKTDVIITGIEVIKTKLNGRDK